MALLDDISQPGASTALTSIIIRWHHEFTKRSVVLRSSVPSPPSYALFFISNYRIHAIVLELS